MLLLAVFLALCAVVHGAGVAVHVALTQRVRYLIPEELQEPKWLNPGAFYPDAFYNCLGHSKAAEESHWPPFLARCVNHYRRKYRGQYGSESAKRLKAFIYALFQHQIADVDWHSLQSYQGLLKHLSEVEFGGDIAEAHTFLDSGGDMLLLYRQLMNLDTDLSQSLLEYYNTVWDVPEDDMLSVLRSMGYVIHGPELRYCMVRGYTGLKAELLTQDAFPAAVYLRKSPLLHSIIDDYYFGGLDEIVNTISLCFAGLNEWFAKGADELDPWSVCSSFTKHDINEEVVALSVEGTLISSQIQNSHFGASVAIGQFLGAEIGDCIAVGAPFEDQQGTVYVFPLSEFEKQSINTMKITGLSKDNVTYPPRFGQTVLKYTLDQIDYLVVSEPGHSKIHFFEGHTEKLVVILAKASTKLGSYGAKQMGVNIEVSESNPRYPDLILSSAYSDSHNAYQRGQVSVLSGLLIAHKLSMYPTREIELEELEVRSVRLPSVLRQENEYEMLGSSVATMKDSLLVGVGSIGAVCVVGEDEYILKDTEVVDLSHLERTTSNENGQCGTSAILSTVYNGETLVLVSCPSKSFQRCVNCGSVNVFVETSGRLIFKTSIQLPDQALFSHSAFGNNAFVHGESLFISSEYFDSRGVVWEIALESLKEGITEVQNDPVVYGPVGMGYTGFGRSMVVTDTYIVIGMPYYGYSTVESSQSVIGKIAIYRRY